MMFVSLWIQVDQIVGLIELLLFLKTYLKGGLAPSWQPRTYILNYYGRILRISVISKRVCPWQTRLDKAGKASQIQTI